MLLLLLIAGSTGVALAGAGESGFAFLKLGIAGRSMAMGEAMSAHASGAAATHYNPSGLLLPLLDAGATAQIMLTHREWIQDTRTEFLGASVQLGLNDAIGFSLNTTMVSDIEIRTRPGAPEGTFTARSLAVGASYAHRFGDDILAGATLRYLYEKILVDEGSGVGVDFGVRYRTGVEGLALGATVANLGSGGTLREEHTTLPALLRAGGVYEHPLGGERPSSLALAADVVHIFPDASTYLNAGAEFRYERLLALRAGYQFGSEGRGFSAGLGVVYSLVGLDYAFSPLGEDLGSAHTISLLFNL